MVARFPMRRAVLLPVPAYLLKDRVLRVDDFLDAVRRVGRRWIRRW